jgi:hypothetical protein
LLLLLLLLLVLSVSLCRWHFWCLPLWQGPSFLQVRSITGHLSFFSVEIKSGLVTSSSCQLGSSAKQGTAGVAAAAKCAALLGHQAL